MHNHYEILCWLIKRPNILTDVVFSLVNIYLENIKMLVNIDCFLYTNIIFHNDASDLITAISLTFRAYP